MKKYVLEFALLLFSLFALTSCPSDEGDPVTQEDGYVKGKVTDTKGNPIAGAEIIIDNTYLHNSNLLSTTDKDGNYSIKLPGNAATYLAYAKIRKTFNGKQYTLDLHPESTEGFTQSGAVRNFQWKLTGKKPVPLSGVYGGFIQVDMAVASTLYDVENIEFTLTPIGTLIDGSAGQILKVKPGQPYTDTYSQLVDIPIGRYTTTALHRSAAGEKPIKLRNRSDRNSSFATSVQLDFEPQTDFCFNCFSLECKE